MSVSNLGATEATGTTVTVSSCCYHAWLVAVVMAVAVPVLCCPVVGWSQRLAR